MIGNVLAHVVSELNTYICLRQGLSTDVQKVVLSPVTNPDGSMGPPDENVVIVTLVDVRQEPASPSMVRMQNQTVDGIGYQAQTPVLCVNLYALFSVYFTADRTRESLNVLTLVLRFFQINTVLTRHNSPGLPPGVDKLEFNLETQDFQQKGYLWGMLGVKYMPFVLFKIRMLALTDTEPEAFLPPVLQTDTQVQSE